MVVEKILQGQGKAREFYFESGKKKCFEVKSGKIGIKEQRFQVTMISSHTQGQKDGCMCRHKTATIHCI